MPTGLFSLATTTFAICSGVGGIVLGRFRGSGFGGEMMLGLGIG
jgi:hypothetical protein